MISLYYAMKIYVLQIDDFFIGFVEIDSLCCKFRIYYGTTFNRIWFFNEVTLAAGWQVPLYSGVPKGASCKNTSGWRLPLRLDCTRSFRLPTKDYSFSFICDCLLLLLLLHFFCIRISYSPLLLLTIAQLHFVLNEKTPWVSSYYCKIDNWYKFH